jgi:CHAT domain-containing protein
MVEARASLPSDTLLLTFSFIEDQLWAFPLTSTSFLEPRLLTGIPSQAKLEQALSWIRMPARLPGDLIQRRAPMMIAAAQETLAELYQQFLAPLEDWLQDYFKLIIVPDGYLFHLPFSCLYNSKNHTYLAETHELRLIPSTTAWQLNTNKPRLQERSVAFAYTGDTLGHITQEIQSIREVNQDFIVFSGSDATTHKFHSELVKSAKYIHLASHAIFRQDNPLFSFVQLANGPLEAQEILQHKLNASLVVLSACETGRGLFRGGDYWGLAIAFLLAGAQSVLATHWRVDDAVTANIMKDFYRHLASRHSNIDALRQAQLACLSHKDLRWQHPFYWAPFFIVGC